MTRALELRDEEQRSDFMHDLQQSIQALARKYGRQIDDHEPKSGRVFRLLIACHPASTRPAESSPDRRDLS